MKKRLRGYWDWLADKDNYGRVMAIATVAGVLVTLVAIFSNQTVLTPPSPGGEVRLSVDDYEARLKRREQEVEKRLEQAHGEERTRLEQELAEVKRQLSDVESAHADALTKIQELEEAVTRLGGDIGDDQLDEIRTAMKEGDFSKADALLAEIEDHADTAIKRAAEAAFQRGKIAALRIRWDEAVIHFDKAAHLDPTYDHLREAGRFAERAARYGTALRRYDEAKPLFRRALEINRETLGEEHPDYAALLNNFANLLRSTGRYDEAVSLLRQALKIGQKTFGGRHPDYATGLGNLAGLLQAAGRYDKAEPLFRQALEIRREMLGEAHPDYATGLNNLAALLQATGRFDDAEPLYRQTLSSTLYKLTGVNAYNRLIGSSTVDRPEEFPPCRCRMPMLKNTRPPTDAVSPTPRHR